MTIKTPVRIQYVSFGAGELMPRAIVDREGWPIRWEEITAALNSRAALRELAREADAEIEQRNALLSDALAHLTELADAWRTGAIRECDGLGGTRSNRNWELVKRLEAIAAKGAGDE